MSTFPGMPALFGRATAVLGEHAVIHITLSTLRKWVAGGDFEAPPDLAELLNEFVAQLEAHFEAEENDGYFGTLRTASVASQAAVERLSAEHVAFLGVARALRAHAREPERYPEFAATLSTLLDELAKHERAESLLLQEYFSEAEL